MATTTTSFSDFVTSAAQEQQPFDHVVIGNPAGDADSIVSALSLAYVDHYLAGTTQQAIKKTPIVSVPRADLGLRRETVLLLEAIGISTSKLTYLDDLSPSTTTTTTTDVTLVDHNKLLYEELKGSHVIEILDHHLDEQAHDEVVGELRNIAFQDSAALVASTCTLVAERMLQSSSSTSMPADLAFALLGVILLDTVNMSEGAGKGTKRDQVVIDSLVDATDWSDLLQKEGTKQFFDDAKLLNTNKLYDFLSQSKFDASFWKSLSVRDALRLDYKQFTASDGSVFGASSVLVPLHDFMAKPGFQKDVLDYMTDCQVPVLTIMSMVIVDDKPKRSMLVCGDITSNSSIANDVAEHLKGTATLEISEKECSPSTDATPLQVRHFDQGNPKASRKQVAPIILDFYKS